MAFKFLSLFNREKMLNKDQKLNQLEEKINKLDYKIDDVANRLEENEEKSKEANQLSRKALWATIAGLAISVVVANPRGMKSEEDKNLGVKYVVPNSWNQPIFTYGDSYKFTSFCFPTPSSSSLEKCSNLVQIVVNSTDILSKDDSKIDKTMSFLDKKKKIILENYNSERDLEKKVCKDTKPSNLTISKLRNTKLIECDFLTPENTKVKWIGYAACKSGTVYGITYKYQNNALTSPAITSLFPFLPIDAMFDREKDFTRFIESMEIQTESKSEC
jgi:hypothetical protein